MMGVGDLGSYYKRLGPRERHLLFDLFETELFESQGRAVEGVMQQGSEFGMANDRLHPSGRVQGLLQKDPLDSVIPDLSFPQERHNLEYVISLFIVATHRGQEM